MTCSTCYSRSNNGGFGKFILIIFFLIVIGVGLVGFQMPNETHYLYGQSVMVAESYTLNQHAMDRHSEKAEMVVQCLNQKGSIANLSNPSTGRVAHICEIEENKFGVLITEGEKSECVTCFIKDKMKQLGKVIQYLANVGYH